MNQCHEITGGTTRCANHAPASNITVRAARKCASTTKEDGMKRQLTLIAIGLLAASFDGFAQEKNPERYAYFGETHIHTRWSVDACIMCNCIIGPSDAFKYAQGET